MLDSLDTLIAFALIFTVVSLLITIVVQMITSLLHLRGVNLSWALAETFEAIEPTLAAQAKGLGKNLADHVLKDPLLSDKQIFSRVSPATAVRADELFDVLNRIAIGRKEAPPDIRNSVISLFKALGVNDGDLKLAGATVKDATDLMKQLLASVETLQPGPPKDAIAGAVAQVANQMSALASNAANQVSRTAADAEERIKQAYQKFESWFDTGQERAQEWFSMHAKVATLILAIAFAFVLQLDTVEIFKTVSTNRGMRDKLVAQTAGVLGQAEKMLGARKGVLESAFESWKGALSGTNKATIEGAKLEVVANDTRESFRSKLRAALESSPDKDDALKAFDAAVDTSAKDALKKESADYKLVKTDLDNTGFSLFPMTSGGRWGKGHFRDHFLGMCFSVLLLSLGAPFWFNTLKSLASLRSSVAGNISDEDKAQQKKGEEKEKKASVPPPTVVPAKAQ